jgi:L-arabinokinase
LSAILYYITGHGFGHAVRSAQVIRALGRAAPDLKIHVRTTAPQWLFGGATTAPSFSSQALDVGIVQPNGLELDLSLTLQACLDLRKRIPSLIEEEVALIKGQGIDLIIGDIPPLCFEIAARANLPSMAITNFTWDVIYTAYADARPEFAPLIDEMKSFYQKACLALTLPYPCDMSVFPAREAIPWITRASSLTKAQARAAFGLPPSATIVLLSFGGLRLNRLPWGELQALKDFYFVATGPEQKSRANLLVLSDAQSHYEDLVRAADVVVTKPGYGIVADALAHRVPVLYTDRGQFPEYPRLVQALTDCATAEYIPQRELLAGQITPYLERLLSKKPNWPAVAGDGADVAARKILDVLRG